MNDKYWQEEIETMPREALQALQLQRLKKTISIASHSPYYGKVFREIGITADDIPQIMETGIDGIALSGTVLRADNPVKEMARLLTLF